MRIKPNQNDLKCRAMNNINTSNDLAQFSILQNNTQVGFAQLTISYTFAFANKFICNQLSYSDNELFNINILSLTTPEHSEQLEYKLNELFNNTIPSFSIDLPLISKDKQKIWHTINATHNKSDNSAFLVFFNIHSFKEKETLLNKQESAFRSIAENSQDFIIRYDLNHKHIYINPITLKYFGIEPHQLIGKTHEESGLFDKDKCEYWRSKIDEVIRTKQSLQTQFIWKKDGKDSYIDWYITPEFNANGTLCSLLSISRDITNARFLESELSMKYDELAEKNESILALNEEFATTNEELSESYTQISSLYKELEESEEKYRNAFFTSPDSITITTLDGTYIDVNKGFTNMSGYDYDEVIYKTSLDINIWRNPKDRENFIEELKTNGHVSNLECEFKTKTGEIKSTLLSSCFIKINGKPHILLIAKDITDWKKTQFENKQFAEIVATMQTGIYVYHLEDINDDRTLKLVNLNAASTISLGKDKADVINQYIDEAFPNLREQDIPNIFANVIKTGKAYNSSEFLYSDSRIKESYFSFKAIPLANNHICVLFEDISSIKQAEAAFKESENKYREIFNSTNEAIFINEAETGKIIETNEAALKQYAFESQADFLTNTIFDLNAYIAPYTQAKAQEYFQRAYKSGNQVFEWLAKKKNGEPFWVEMSLRKAILAGKDRIIAVTRDINERKKAEEALRDSEQRFNMAFRNSPVSITISTLTSDFYIDINNTFLREFKFSRNEIIGKSTKELSIYVNPQDRERLLEKLKNEGLVYGEECLIKTKTGETLTCLISIGIISIQGEWCLLTTIIDISARKLMEQDLIKAKDKAEESDRLKSAFLANMSHEIRTPMNAIKGFAQLLERTDMQEAKKYKFTQIISQRTDDLLTLINDLLDIAKIEAGQLTLVEQRDNVNNLFNEIFQFFKAQQDISEPKPVELSFKNELSWTENYICTDFFRLRQILINLINNALKFTEQGCVIFGCKLNQNNELLFYVKDSGLGIPEDKYSLIFEPFRQVNEAFLSKKKGGTGLGLSIVKGLVELMQGKVWFESEYGKGTTFFFTLPFNQTPILEQKVEITPEREYSWIGKKILIVEDDEANTILIKELLDNTKATCFFAANAQQGLKFLKENGKIDIVLMDIQLPDINGFELTSRFKEIDPNLIIIAQTAYAAETDKKKALNAGCIGFLAKPIDQYKLLLMMQMCFDGEYSPELV